MKELNDLMRSVSQSIKAFARLLEKTSEKLETASEVKEQPASEPVMKPRPAAKKEPPERKVAKKKLALKAAAKTKSQPKAGPKTTSKRKPAKPESGVSIVETVKKVIEDNPGINFKSLQEKTRLETKQVLNSLPPLKKAGKIKSEGRGIYYPIPGPVSEEQSQKLEETMA